MGSPGFCLCAWSGVPASREPQCPAISPLYPVPPHSCQNTLGWAGSPPPNLPDLTGMSGGLGALGELGRRPPEPQRLGCACRTWVQPTAWLCSSRLRARLGRSTEEAFSLRPGSCSVLPSTLRLGRPETRVAPGRPSPGPLAQQSCGGRGHRGGSGSPRVWRKGPASSSLHPSPCPPALSAECCWKLAPSEAPEGLFPNQDPRRHWDPLLQDTPPSARASSTDPRPVDMPTGADHCWQPSPRTSRPPSELLRPLSQPPEPRTLPTPSWPHSGPCTPAPQGGQPLPGEPGSPHPHLRHVPLGRHSPPGSLGGSPGPSARTWASRS